MQPELIAAIVQDAETNRVLMLAWMDEEALRLTRETGEAHFFSRSRGRLWRKGATSGNTLAVDELRDDCDGDAILLRVRPAGPTCHTGSASCFAPWLWRRVVERAANKPEGSYVARLVGEGAAAAARKVGEEGVEVALAGAGRATSGSSPSSPTSGSTRMSCSPPAVSIPLPSRTSSRGARRLPDRADRLHSSVVSRRCTSESTARPPSGRLRELAHRNLRSRFRSCAEWRRLRELVERALEIGPIRATRRTSASAGSRSARRGGSSRATPST